jgi:sulfofructose kinase
MALNSNRSKAPVILCAGIAVEDFLFKVDRFPEPGTKINSQALVASVGGCAANAAVAIARLGGNARFTGPVGTDAATRRFLDALSRMGVDGSGVAAVEEGAISVSGIFIDANGEKMVVTQRGSGLEKARPADVNALVADVDLVLADNRFPDFVAPILIAARARGIPVIVDGDQAMAFDHPVYAPASHVIFSSEGLSATTGLSDLGAALHRASETIKTFAAVTNGPEDILWIERGNVRSMAAFTVAAIDTLGAGDTFHGAFALALAEGLDEIAAMRFGSAAAALKCTRFGGISGTPVRSEVESFLIRSA